RSLRTALAVFLFARAWAGRLLFRRAEARLTRRVRAGPAAAEAARSWAAEAAGTAARARTAEAPAGTRAAEAAARSRAAFLPRTRLAHRERTAHERLLIEALNGFFGLLAFEVLDERKPARPSRFAIDRDDHLRWVA